MTLPDFFIVGAPKCGTSLMTHLLRCHPDLHVPLKELHFFGSDLGFNTPPRSSESYRSFFCGVPAGVRAGDSSTWYLYSKRAAAEIREACPDARILVLLRDPVSQMHALHGHLLFTGNEDIEDFDAALAAEPDRRAGRRIPRHSSPRGALHYREVASFAAQIERYLRAFGRERVHVVLAEDFRHDVRGTLREVLRFLGVREHWPGMERTFTTTKRIRNEHKRARSRAMVRFLKRPAQQAVLRELVPEPLFGWLRLLKALRRMNIRFEPRPPLPEDLRARLVAELAPDVERLAALIGRDLGAWTRGGS